ncbi:hypothetical protein L288_19150 [Sphingobium quisquiliarum P25]|uniref:Uncharacterized protein n=1 Tax=Sphingobium quisquiliarum P25 TaxID=1329909 RepID=T0HQK5_9SPHN|nr:hypothetical protein [Sphingobium quisquiliarum]EQA99803.1 hypothetical protein L288_19150 [Sphingobium quisquiliarum P25]
MGQNVVYLHGQPEPIGHFLRIGNSGHRQLETLLDSGKMMLDRVVVDAAAVARQHDLIASLAEAGGELILDTNVAELSSARKYNGAVKSAPWANPVAMLTADDLRPNANRDVIGQIARFAVQHGFHMVQAPTHLLEGSPDAMFAVDRASTMALRNALDAEGGRHIGINYPLMIKSAVLRDPVQRRAFIAGLEELPFDNLWFRISGFGADASPAGLRRYIAAVMDFQRLERPIVADGVGGLAGLAIVAFGAAGGICHGVAEKERFDASDWNKPPEPRGQSFGREKRVLIGSLDRMLSEKQLDALMSTPGARKALSCNDTSCCPRGFDDMLKDPKAHYLRQRSQGVQELSRIPDSRRAQHYLDKQLTPVERAARNVAKLRVGDEGLKKILEKSSERLEKIHSVLDDLSGTIKGAPRAHAPSRQPRGKPAAAAGKRNP